MIAALSDVAPDLGKYIIEFAFGDIYCREDLNLEEREMVTLASLLTLGGCENQLDVHINGALNVGITPKRIVGIVVQCIPYTGFPRVLNAVGVAKRVFKDRQVSIGK
ncbi:MAG: carboxymuconolactone decarboxylase family protein [Pelosinus sp.]|nr:carboxymuconolactone decarboxylase family protein [Pelosinus sp.]